MTNEQTQLEARLLANRRIADCGYLTSCWVWTRSCRKKGYGQTSIDKGHRNVAVHRVAAWLWLGFDLASSLKVLHRCDNPPCFNPEHLFIGTNADNTADMVAKGRARNNPHRGEAHASHVLTEDQVREIRARTDAVGHARGIYSTLAREYGVSHVLVSRIARRLNWAHLD